MEQATTGSEHHDPSATSNPRPHTASSESLNSYRWGKRHEVLYDVELSTIYHRRRERFFDGCDKVVKACAVLGGSAALTTVFGQETVSIAVAIVTIPATLSLVFGLSERACRHSFFARDYKALQADIVRRGEYDFGDEDLNAWRARILSLESSEPRQLTALVTLCQNEIARRTKAEEHPLPLHQRLLAHFWDFGGQSA